MQNDGGTREGQEEAFIEPLEHKLEEHLLIHSFLCVPEYSIFLLGRDILHEVEATIHLMGEKMETGVP